MFRHATLNCLLNSGRIILRPKQAAAWREWEVGHVSSEEPVQALSGAFWLMAGCQRSCCHSPARADDWSDCNAGEPQKVEAGCAAIVGDTALLRAGPDQGLASNRARVYLNSGKAGSVRLPIAKLRCSSMPIPLPRC